MAERDRQGEEERKIREREGEGEEQRERHLSPCACTQEGHVKTQQEGDHLQARRRGSPELNRADILIPDFELPEL